MNPQPVVRPNVVQSSPSPTSIITSINQSNYLCSQAPDTQSSSTPQNIPNKDDVFQHPGKTNIVDLDKQTQFKQVYIIQKPKDSNRDTENITENQLSQPSYTIINGLADVSFKTAQSIENQSSDKQEKYDLKNLAINSNVPEYSNIQMHQQQLNKTEIHSTQHVKDENYRENKVKFFMPAIPKNISSSTNMRSNISQVFVNDQLRKDYNMKGDPECVEEKADTKHLTMTLTDRPFTNDTENKEHSTKC